MNYAEADEDIKVFTKAVLDGITTIPALVQFYADKSKDKVQGDTPWIRVTTQSTASAQAAFGDALRTFTRNGLHLLEVFTPLGKGLPMKRDITNSILTGFEGKRSAGGVVFRNAVVTDVGDDGDWYKTNVVINFEYDEFK